MVRLIDAERFKDRFIIGKEEIEKAPIVEAIPISWLVDEIHKAVGNECFQLAAYIQFIIDKWRLDNDEKEIDSSAEI